LLVAAISAHAPSAPVGRSRFGAATHGDRPATPFAAMSVTGTVKSYNPFKGFGFLTQSDGQEVFVHVSDCNGMAPTQTDSLTFEVELDPKSGKLKATNVQGCTGSAEAAKGGGKGKGSGGCQGTVKSYNGMKGWGFLEYNGQDVFLHVKDCGGGTPQAGDWLTFDIEDAGQGNGKLKATNVSGCTGWSEKGWDKGGGKGKGGYGAAFGGKGDWGKGGGWGAGPYGGKGGGCGWGGGKDAWGGDGGWGKGGFGKGKGKGW